MASPGRKVDIEMLYGKHNRKRATGVFVDFFNLNVSVRCTCHRSKRDPERSGKRCFCPGLGGQGSTGTSSEDNHWIVLRWRSKELYPAAAQTPAGWFSGARASFGLRSVRRGC